MRRLLLLATALAPLAPGSAADRGKDLYNDHCMMCHQATGQGLPPAFPPLAGAEHVLADPPDLAIRAVVEGLRGEITVAGVRYDGEMPPALLDDAGVAEVLTYIRSTWGNQAPPVDPATVAAVRATTEFPTFDALVASRPYPPLPPAPDGFALREILRLDDFGVRLGASQEPGRVLVLLNTGDLVSVEIESGQGVRVVEGDSYLDRSYREAFSRGFCLSREGELFLTANYRDETATPVSNIVTIFRAPAPRSDAPPVTPKAWFTTAFPAGIGGFNHAVSHIAQGPDGMLYVTSGSRTDGGEPGGDPRYFSGGETPLTACLWRLDPAAEIPSVEVFARGLRNSYGFVWDAAGNLIATYNGPDAHRPEELNVVVRGAHYGFPFQFGDGPASDKPYPHTPDPPDGLSFARPLEDTRTGLATFAPHSSPCGIAVLDDTFPPQFAGAFLVARSGNLLALDADTGFDLLLVHADLTAGTCTTAPFLGALGRPLDIVQTGSRSLCLLEYSRSTTFRGAGPARPGRLVEIISLAAP
ncbi:hypothetical protein BH23VER1_BH23VER1_10730 [soil metagenome]